MNSRWSASRPDLYRLASSALTLTPDDALSVLEYWQASAERIVIVYRNTDEPVTRIAHGRVRNATPRELRIDMDHERLRVAMHPAAFEFRTLGAGLSRPPAESPADGLLIRPKLDHWVFLRSDPLHPARPRRAYY